MKTIGLEQSELSVFRPAWTSEKLMAADDAYYCGVKSRYFWKTFGMPGQLFDRHIAQQEGRQS